MKWTALLVASATVFAALPQIAAAEDAAPVDALKQELHAKLPGNWQMHVRWRDGAVLASFMPPYHEAFDLWYRPNDLLQKMRDLCPTSGDAIWHMLNPGEDIVMEPTVGGKTTLEMRVSCRKTVAPS